MGGHPMWNKLKTNLYDKKVPTLPLAIFRIGYALLLGLEIIQMMLFRDLIFLKDSLASRHDLFLTILFVLWAMALAMILAGVRMRIAAVVNYCICVYILGFVTVNEANNWQVDSLFLTGAFLLLFLPAASSLSMESLMEHRRQARIRVRKLPRPQGRFIHTALLILMMGLFYLDSILYKLSSSMYLTGLGLWGPASLPFTTFHDVSWLINHEVIVRILGYGLLVYESLYIFLIWFRKFRTPLSIIGIMLHAGVLFVFPIPVMSLLVIGIHLAIIPDDVYRKVYDSFLAAKHKRLTVYYDRLCPLCRQTVGILSALDLRKAIEWRALQDYAAEEPLLSGIPEEDLLHDIYAVEKQSVLHKGVDTYAAILRSTGWAYPLGLLLGLPPVHGIASRVYERVAAKRKREGGCTDSTCGIGIAPPPGKKPSWFAERFWPAGVFLLLWFLSFAILSFGTPVYGKYITGENSRITQSLKDTASVYKRVVYPLFGWTNHGVYTESHFENYKFQTRLVYREGEVVRPLPIMDEHGFAGHYLIGRQWDSWTYAAASPELAYDLAVKALTAYASFWTSKHNVDLNNGEGIIEIQKKPITAPLDRFSKNLLKSNMEQPWEGVGEIRREGDGFRLNVNEGAPDHPRTWGAAVGGL
jgi:predicted DCC family thiol-disulfide oxidoreductase YuxK